MNIIFALLMGTFAGLNCYFAIIDFMKGHIGSGSFSAIATFWCLVVMIKYLVEE
jgi:hypothetical protein